MERILIFIILVAFAILAAAILYKTGGLGVAGGYILGGARAFVAAMGPRDDLKPSGELKLEHFPAPKGIEAAVKTDSYAPPTAAEQKKLEAAAKTMGMTADSLTSARDILVAQNISSKVGEVIEHAEELVKESVAGKSILELASMHKLPPVMVARQILLDSGLKHNQVREILYDETEDAHAHRLRAQIDEAEVEDCSGRTYMGAIRERAMDLEKRFAVLLKKAKIDFMTEEDLKEAQTKNPDLGKPVATPDFFFKTPITLNGKLCNWIDVKNYPLFAGPDVLSRYYNRNAAQVYKYNRHFGRGAIVFAGGVMDGAKLVDREGQTLDVDLIGYNA